MDFNIILPSIHRSYNFHLFFRIPQQNTTYNSLPSTRAASPTHLTICPMHTVVPTCQMICAANGIVSTSDAARWNQSGLMRYIPRETVSTLNRHNNAGLVRASRATFQVLAAVLLNIRLSGYDYVWLIGSRRQGQAVWYS